MAPLEDALAVVASIGIVMLGSLPMAELLTRLLKQPLLWLGKKCGMNSISVAGFLVGIVSAIPAITMLKHMDKRGKVVNVAFLVSAASMLAAHLGFTVSEAPGMLPALLAVRRFCGDSGSPSFYKGDRSESVRRKNTGKQQHSRRNSIELRLYIMNNPAAARILCKEIRKVV